MTKAEVMKALEGYHTGTYTTVTWVKQVIEAGSHKIEYRCTMNIRLLNNYNNVKEVVEYKAKVEAEAAAAGETKIWRKGSIHHHDKDCRFICYCDEKESHPLLQCFKSRARDCRTGFKERKVITGFYEKGVKITDEALITVLKGSLEHGKYTDGPVFSLGLEKIIALNNK